MRRTSSFLAQQLGDFDGDGAADFLLSGPQQAFLFLGPLDTTGLNQAGVLADYEFDVTSLGQPAQRMGDIDADGKTDLLFHRYDAGTNSTIITVIFGGRVMPRQITANTLDPIFSRQIVLSNDELNTNEGSLAIQVMAARWSGHKDLQSGRFYDDVVVASPVANSVNVYGYIFAGDVIQKLNGIAPVSSGDALVELQLFSTTASTGEINSVFPVRNTFANNTVQSFTLIRIRV